MAIFAYVAERDNQFVGACAPEGGDEFLVDWAKSGATISTVKSREEYNEWYESLTQGE